MRKKDIAEKLKNNDYRLTQQRTAILDVMWDNRGQHLSAEEVLNKARQKVPNIGIATVYRTLEKLAGIDILYKTIFNEDKYRYEINDNSGEHQHHHIICLRCGKIFELEDDFLCSLELQLKDQGFDIIDHELKFYVHCPECKQGI